MYDKSKIQFLKIKSLKNCSGFCCTLRIAIFFLLFLKKERERET
jgi:hypothetical protein